MEETELLGKAALSANGCEGKGKTTSLLGCNRKHTSLGGDRIACNRAYSRVDMHRHCPSLEPTEVGSRGMEF